MLHHARKTDFRLIEPLSYKVCYDVSFPRRRESSSDKALKERQIGQHLPEHFVSSLRDYSGLDSRLRGNDGALAAYKFDKTREGMEQNRVSLGYLARYSVFLTICLLILGLSSCTKEMPQTKPLLLASIHPYELILQQLAGSEFEVKSIIPAGASPHTWSPGPSDLKAFGNAMLIVSNGLGLETSLEKNFASRSQVHVEVATLLKEVLPMPEIAAEEHHEQETEAEHHHKGLDPHLWTSPRLMLRLVLLLEKELATRFPNSALVFKANAETMRKELDTLIATIDSERRVYKNPGIITYHNSFQHFCEDFEIANLGWVQSSPGKEPTPKELSALGNTIKTNSVRAIFMEPQMDRKAGEVLAREFGLKLLMLDPLGSTIKAMTISELIGDNWQSMKQGFAAP